MDTGNSGTADRTLTALGVLGAGSGLASMGPEAMMVEPCLTCLLVVPLLQCLSAPVQKGLSRGS